MDASVPLSLIWALPFAALLLSIAGFPLVAPGFWHRHQTAVCSFWLLCFVGPWCVKYGVSVATHDVLHALFLEYIPFISIIGALFVMTGGIYLKNQWLGTPRGNVGILLVGSILASFIGTTGAAMLLIRPLIRANSWRRHNHHIKVFFIFMVANVGGALTPLGDPPLFMGYLKGVDFFWPLQHLWAPTALVLGVLAALFFVMDSYCYAQEKSQAPSVAKRWQGLHVAGWHNVALLLGVAVVILVTGTVSIPGGITLGGVAVPTMNLLREGLLWGLTVISLMTTSKKIHTNNQFSWAPLKEVMMIFLGIFLTIIPVILMLKSGIHGPLGVVHMALNDATGAHSPLMFYGITGLLSAFLDNAPTYLVFFYAAGGDAATLMTTHATTLAAISCGAVFMGALTYIGNAPNFMVKAIAEEQGVRMPSFFGYMGWSLTILMPILVLTGWVFFR